MLAPASSVCNTKKSFKIHAFSLGSNMGRMFSTMVGIDEEFSRPHTLLTTDHHFLLLMSGLLRSLLTLS